METKSGVELIAYERQEQISKHGFDSKHDSCNVKAELVTAAVYLLTEDENYFPYESWDIEWMSKFKAKDKTEKLVIAGALIAAEIDRLQNETL